VTAIVDPNADPGEVPMDFPDISDLPPEMVDGLLDALDLPVVADGSDPFAKLDPRFRRLAGHLMAHFHPSDLPRMVRPFAPAAPGLLAQLLAAKPVEAYATAVELIDLVIRDLRIPFHDVAGAWGVTSRDMPQGEVGGAWTIGDPLPPDD
jgi:hypothetical protein